MPVKHLADSEDRRQDTSTQVEEGTKHNRTVIWIYLPNSNLTSTDATPAIVS